MLNDQTEQNNKKWALFEIWKDNIFNIYLSKGKHKIRRRNEVRERQMGENGARTQGRAEIFGRAEKF